MRTFVTFIKLLQKYTYIIEQQRNFKKCSTFFGKREKKDDHFSKKRKRNFNRETITAENFLKNGNFSQKFKSLKLKIFH